MVLKPLIPAAANTPAAIFNKILSINKNMISSGRKDAALNPSDESELRNLRTALESSSSIPQEAFPLIVRIITRWAYSDRLPGLDVLRCVTKYPTVVQYSDPDHGSLVDLAISASLPDDETPNENAIMMGLRTLANMFLSSNGRIIINAQADQAIAYLERIIGVSSDPIGPYNRNVLVAATTVAINLSVLASRENQLPSNLRRRLAITLGKILSSDQTDSEVLYRTLVALGTLLSASSEAAAGLGVKTLIQGAAGRSAEGRVKAVAKEAEKLAPN